MSYMAVMQPLQKSGEDSQILQLFALGMVFHKSMIAYEMN